MADADDDLRFAQILLQLGHVTKEQVRECAAELARRADDGTSVGLGDLLVRKGYLTLGQVEEAFRLRESAVTLVCTVCASSSPVVRYDQKKTYRCRCGAALKPPAPTGRSASTVTFNLKALPDEVRKAAADPEKLFGKYVLLKELGRGGMGVVFRAWDTALQRPVAIKFLLGEGQNPTDIQRFLREAQTAGSLNHPNIIATLDAGEIEGRYFIAMHYVDGHSLHGRRLPLRRALEVLRTAALAVDHAHENGIIHRDLKPHNIMVDQKGKPFVMDFGLARAVTGNSQLTQSGMVMGTPSYMAPEQAQGDTKRMGKRLDVYALGATLYELLTGRPPFDGKSPLDVMMKVVRQDPTPVRRLAPSVPAEVEVICEKAMEKDPARRYASAKALADDLNRFLHGDPILARPASVMAKVRKRVRKNRALMLPVVAAGAILVAGACGWIVWRSNRAGQVRALVRDADRTFDEGRLKEALDLYTRADGVSPGDAHVGGRIKDCRRKIDADRADVERARDEQKEREARRALAQPKFDQGMLHLKSAQPDLYRAGSTLEGARRRAKESIAAFNEASALCPEHHDAFFQRGCAQLLLLEYDPAVASFSRAIELNPRFVLPLIERGLMYMHRYVVGQMDFAVAVREGHPIFEWRRQALADLTAAEQAGLAEKKDYVQALKLFAENKYVESIAICTRIIAADAGNEAALKLRGDGYHLGMDLDALARGDPAHRQFLERSIQDYSRAIELRVNYPEALAMRAIAFGKLGNAEGRRADIAAALKIDPVNFLMLWERGKMAADAGDFNGAIASYTEAIKARPETYLARVNRASSYGNRGASTKASAGPAAARADFEAGIADLKKAVETNPDHMFAWQLMGAIYSQMGLNAEAIAAMEKALSIDDRFPVTWSNLGATRQNMGDLKGAREAYRKAIERGHPKRDELENRIRQIDIDLKK